MFPESHLQQSQQPLYSSDLTIEQLYSELGKVEYDLAIYEFNVQTLREAKQELFDRLHTSLHPPVSPDNVRTLKPEDI